MWIVSFIILAIALFLMGDNSLLVLGLKIFLFIAMMALFGFVIGSDYGYIFLFGIAICVGVLLISIFFGEKIKKFFTKIPKKIKIIFVAVAIFSIVIAGTTYDLRVLKEQNIQRKSYDQILTLRDQYKETLLSSINDSLCEVNVIETIKINPFYIEDQTNKFFDYIEINITLNQNTLFDSLNQLQQDTITNQILKVISDAYTTNYKKNNKYIKMISNYNNCYEEPKYISADRILVSTNITLNLYYKNECVANEIVLID